MPTALALALVATVAPLAAGFFGAATLGLRWTALALTLGAVVTTLRKGWRPALIDLLPALTAACAMGLGGWVPGLFVLVIAAVPLPMLMATRLEDAARIREEQAPEQLGMAFLGPLAVLLKPLALPLLIPLAWALRQGGASKGELTEHRLGRTLLHEERLQLTKQARHLDLAAQEHAEKAEALQARAEALAMLEQLSSRELTEEEALQESLRAIRERLPGSSCALFGADLARLAADGERRPTAQTLADCWASRRRWLDENMHGTEVLWPFAKRGIVWIWAPDTLNSRTLLTLETFAGYALLLVERARHQNTLRAAWERESALRTELDTSVIRLRRLGQLAPELARADGGREVLQQGYDFARALTGGRTLGLQALGMLLGPQPVRPVFTAPLSTHGGMWVEGQALHPGEEEALGLLALLLGAALERIQANAGLMQATKMAAIGQLAAGVAHELNTPLGALTIAIDVAMQTVESRPDRARTRLETSLQALERMRAIIAKLLYYSRESGQGRRRLSLAEVVRDTMPLVSHAFQIDNVNLHLELEEVEAAVDPGEIQQVIINLLVNAKLAVMSPGATGRDVLLRVATAGPDALVEVRDTGPGVDPAIADRIFEPFFTTREVGQGTGLGLSISQQIVRSHGGTLSWQAVEGGTSFRMVLPRGGAAGAPEASPR